LEGCIWPDDKNEKNSENIKKWIFLANFLIEKKVISKVQMIHMRHNTKKTKKIVFLRNFLKEKSGI